MPPGSMPPPIDQPPARASNSQRVGRPLRIGIISNPNSGQNVRHGLLTAIGALLRTYPKVEHRITGSLDGLLGATTELTAGDTEVLVVNGGDGTVQAVLTALLREPRPSLPVLAVLASGSSNTTAHNLGYGKRPLAALGQLLAATARGELPGRIEARPVLRADAGAQPQYSMMFGAGAVYHGILFFHRSLETRGLHGELGAGLAVATFVSKLFTGRGSEMFPPMRGEILVDGVALPPETYFGLLASTMDRQVVGIRPYWGVGPGPIRMTLLRTSPRYVTRALVSLFRDRKSSYLRPEMGYRSVHADEVRLHFDSGFTLDGELFGMENGNQSVLLSARQQAYFLRATA